MTLSLPRPRSLALVGALLLVTALVARRCAPGPAAAPPPPADTAAAAAWRQERAALIRATELREGVIGRLQDRVRGLEERRPERVLVFDTLVRLERDTVVLGFEVDARGRADLTAAVPADSGHRPVQELGRDLADCDGGLAVRGLDVVCRRAPLGHLSVIGRVGAMTPFPIGSPPAPTAELGLRWTPAFRAKWAVELLGDERGRVGIRVERGVRIF